MLDRVYCRLQILHTNARSSPKPDQKLQMKQVSAWCYVPLVEAGVVAPLAGTVDAATVELSCTVTVIVPPVRVCVMWIMVVLVPSELGGSDGEAVAFPEAS